MYLIQDTTLKSTADKIRERLNEQCFIDPAVIASEGTFNVVDGVSAVQVAYREYIDFEGQGDGIKEYDKGDTLVAYGFLANNEGEIVPVIYDTDLGENEEYYDYTPDIDEPFFYVGKAVVDGVTYDKWRKIHVDAGGGSSGYFAWDSEGQKYIYTNEIVNMNKINPVDFPEKIDEVYNKGYEAGCSGEGVTLPTLTNEGTADDLLSGKQLIDGEGNIVEGAIATKTSSDLTASGKTVTVPAGYYASQATKTVSDSNLIASNIKSGVKIFGVTGTMKSYDEAIEYYAPLIIQAEATAVKDSNYDGSFAYQWSDFQNKVVGNTTFNIDDIITGSLNVRGNQATITNNLSTHKAKVYFEVTYTYTDSITQTPKNASVYKTVDVAPSTSVKVSISFTGTKLSTAPKLEYVKWSTVETSETSEE